MIVIDGFKENTKDKRKFQFQLAFPEFFEFMEVEKISNRLLAYKR